MASRSGTPKKGDIIRFRRKIGYYHYGIYIGDGRVIHRSSGEGAVVLGAKSEKSIIRNYLDGDERPYSPDEIVKRAKSQLGEKGYNIATKNCEHFVTWCRYGVEKSEQVENFKRKVNETASNVYFSIRALFGGSGSDQFM